MHELFQRCYRSSRGPLLGAFVLCAAGSATWVAARIPPPNPGTAETLSAASTDQTERPPRHGSDGLLVPDDIARRMRLRTAVAVAPTRPRKLAPFQGRLALDNNALTRVRSNFGGEVVELGRT